MVILYAILSLVIAFIVIYFSYIYYPFKHPLPTESDYSHHNSPSWELYYCSKYPNSIRRAEKGSNYEQYFANMKSPQYEDALNDSKEIKINMVGDLMVRTDLVAPGSRNLWNEVGDYIFDSDLTFGNLEFAVNPNDLYHKIIRYSVPFDHADPFLKDTNKYGKFSAVAVSNNHINDSFHPGICSTLDYLDSIDMKYSGSARTPEEQDEFPIFEVNGVKIAFLSYTFSTNGLPLQDDHKYGTNLVRFNALKDEDYDPSLIFHHIKLAKERGADIIISSNHWGIEFEYYPASRIIKRAHELMDAGIDIIMGHHPHILNPSEWYQTKDGRNALSLYTLGNLTGFALKRPTMRMSEIASAYIEVGKDKDGNRVVRLKGADKMPAYFMKKGWGNKSKKSDHRILPVLETAKKLRNKEKMNHISWLEKILVKGLDKEYRKYFMQKDAFTYN